MPPPSALFTHGAYLPVPNVRDLWPELIRRQIIGLRLASVGIVAVLSLGLLACGGDDDQAKHSAR
jgi:hypothetical protein